MRNLRHLPHPGSHLLQGDTQRLGKVDNSVIASKMCAGRHKEEREWARLFSLGSRPVPHARQLVVEPL